MAQGNQCCCGGGEPPEDLCAVPCVRVVIAGVSSITGCGHCQDCENANGTYTLSYRGIIDGICVWGTVYCGPHAMSDCSFAAIFVEAVDLGDGSWFVIGLIAGLNSMYFGTVTVDEPADWSSLVLTFNETVESGDPWLTCDGTGATMTVTTIEGECPQFDTPCPNDFDFTNQCNQCDTENPQPESWLLIIAGNMTRFGTSCPGFDCNSLLGSYVLSRTADCHWRHSVPFANCAYDDIFLEIVFLFGSWRLQLTALENGGAGQTVINQQTAIILTRPSDCGDIDCSFPDAPYTGNLVGGGPNTCRVATAGDVTYTLIPL